MTIILYKTFVDRSIQQEPPYNEIDDVAFELFAIHCGIGRGIRQKKIQQEKKYVVNVTN